MKSLTIIVLTLFLNACGGSKEVASNLTDVSTSSKMKQTTLTIKYTTSSRANTSNFTITESKVVYQKNRTDLPSEMPIDKKDWKELKELILGIGLKNITTITAPSTAHQYDGAAAANFSVIDKEGTVYRAPTFDAGEPNKKIAPVINKIMSLIPLK